MKTETPLINRSVLMSDTDNYEGVIELNLYSDENIQPDKNLAKIEHDAFGDALRKVGISVLKRRSAKGCQDSVYTANWAFCRGDVAVMAKLPNARHAEERHAERILWGLGKKTIHPPLSIERYSGQGDTLLCGNVLFVGSGYRTDPEMAEYLQHLWPDYTVVPVQTVPKLDDDGEPVINKVSGWEDSEFYDIDLAIGIIRPPTLEGRGLIAVCREAFTDSSLERIEKAASENNIDIIYVSYDEAVTAFACNFISNGRDAVVMSEGAPQFEEDLSRLSIRSILCKLKELNKAGGGGRCVGLTLDNE